MKSGMQIFRARRTQAGMSIVGLIFLLSIIAMIALLAAKITPTAMEYLAVKRAIVTAKASGTSVRDIQVAFDKQAEVSYITSIKGNDLTVEKSDSGYEVSFYYTKKIPLVGPASLLLEYEGTTAKVSGRARKAE